MALHPLPRAARTKPAGEAILLVIAVASCAGPKEQPRPASEVVGLRAAIPGPAPVPSEAVAAPPAAEAAPHAQGGPHVFAKTRFVWIRERPEWASQWIGYLWPGESLGLKSPRPIYARGCDAWYAVLPRGYVCVDGRRATLDPRDPELADIQKVHIARAPSEHRYARSLGAERYEKPPDRAEQRLREPDLARHLSLVDSARSGGSADPSLEGVDFSPAPMDAVEFSRLPIDLQVPRPTLRRDSTLAFLEQYRHDGRSFLLTADLMWVPKDRVRPYESVTFEGAHLGPGAKLPIAFFRERERSAFERGNDGHFSASSRRFARLAWVELTGTTEIEGPLRYLETREPGLWVLDADSVVPAIATSTPWGARVEQDPARAVVAPHERKTWIEASVYGGWLIAYENTRPVFLTLIAPGRGGGKSPQAKDLISTSSTPLGTFPITGKFVTASMDGPDQIVHSDVPWVQNFWGAHAIHSAYWHDSWGERVSGGCMNVSPADGKFLFDFTEPALPEGWHGVRWDPHLGPATLVIVHR